MFIFTCQIFARQLLFPLPPDNSWPLQKTSLGCTPWQTTSDPSKSLSEVVRANQVGWLQCCCHFVLIWSHVEFLLCGLTFQSSIPPASPKNSTCPSSTNVQVKCPHISDTSPLSIPKESCPQHQCPGQLSYEWVKGTGMAPCWAFSYLFNILIDSSHHKHLTPISFLSMQTTTTSLELGVGGSFSKIGTK